jgi:catechol 2,3-dioxygenase-like lactoylglutathione lyase family enzyme
MGGTNMEQKKLINGMHHAALRCCGLKEMERAIAFYSDVLGLSVLRRWGEGSGSGCMIDTGDRPIEMFADAEPGRKAGTVDHIALSTDDVDAVVQKVREAGFPVIVEPKDIDIACQPPLRARIAFIEGAAGESIEIFDEK